jgi:hypothetical protein
MGIRFCKKKKKKEEKNSGAVPVETVIEAHVIRSGKRDDELSSFLRHPPERYAVPLQHVGADD